MAPGRAGVTPLDWSSAAVVIGEVAQAHDGSLDLAHAHIDAIAGTGADAVKFQTHIAAAESREDEPWRVRFSRADDTRYAYWQRMEFRPEQWVGLERHARDRGLAFLSSPFSLEAVDLLERVGVAAWKIASGELSNGPLLDRTAGSGRPMLLSSGMSGWAELDAAVGRVRRASAAPLAVLQCTSAYPVAPEQLGLNVVGELAARYDCASGISDHSGTIFPALAATALGGRVVEVHVALSRDMPGPDTAASVTVPELAELVRGVRMIDAALRSPVDKDAAARELEPMRRLFTKSVVTARELPAGAVLSAADLALRKPGDGLPPERLDDLPGRRLRRAMAGGERLTDADLEER